MPPMLALPAFPHRSSFSSYRPQFDDREPREPISLWWKLLGWVSVVGLNLAFGFYVTLFGIKQVRLHDVYGSKRQHAAQGWGR